MIDDVVRSRFHLTFRVRFGGVAPGSRTARTVKFDFGEQMGTLRRDSVGLITDCDNRAERRLAPSDDNDGAT